MEKILIADDVPANRVLLRRMLERKGYEVVQAVDGHQAVDLYQREHPDLILMDINMPRLAGGQATEQIKRMAGPNHVPVIFVTATKEQTSLVDALASGGDDFINKPVDLEVLHSKIRAHLRIQELNRELERNNAELRRHNQYLAHEQELAEYFFENALKQSFLEPDYIRYHISPMSAFCGDVVLAERGPNGGLYVLVGDFTGHGLSSAMGTLPAAQVFFRMSRKGMCVGDIAREMNRHLATLMPIEMFFAATLLEISASGERLSIWAGGMPDAYLIGREGGLRTTVRSRHMPLGILGDDEFDSSVRVLAAANGDRLFVCSDGVLEAGNRNDESFGADRLKTLLSTPSEGRFERVVGERNEFRGSSTQEDDITLVEVACTALPPAEGDGAANALERTAMVPLSISATLSAQQLRELEPVEPLVSMLAAQPALARHKGLIHTVLSELFCNAVDHGLLKLDSGMKTDEEHFVAYYAERERALRQLREGSINIDIAVSPDPAKPTLTMRVRDSGEGFAAPGSKDDERGLYGRGMEIVAELCEGVTVSDGGRTVEVVYALA